MLCCYFHLDYTLSTTLVGLAGLLLSCIVTFGNTELTTSTQCGGTPSYRPVSDFVWAYQTRLQPGQSCDTNQTSVTGEEVHLIVVKLPPLSSSSSSSSSSRRRKLHQREPSGGRRTVRLTVLARHRGSHLQHQDAPGPMYNLSSRPMKFILVASQSVRWHVTLQGVPSARQKHLFIISRNSNIKFSRKRTRLLAKSRKRDVPSWRDSSNLIGWATKRFGAITSRSQVTSDDIKLFAGRDEHSSNGQCGDDQMTTSGRIFSSYGVPKQVEGCVAVGYTTFMDAQTFVIELLKVPPVSTTITLEIIDPTETAPAITTRDGLITRGHNPGGSLRGKGGINIVVKSPLENVKWNLRAGYIEQGVVNIVSNVDVSFQGVKANTEVSIRIEDMDVSGQDLLQWTHKFVAPVQMYAGVQDVDTILVTKPPREKIKTQESTSNQNNYRNGMTTGVNSNNDSNNKKLWTFPGIGNVGGKSGMGTGGPLGRLWKKRKGDGGVDWDQDVMKRMIQTRCDMDHLEVIIAKELLKMVGVNKSEISLQDLKCGMSDETDTSVILATRLNQCGTHVLSKDSVNLYFNEVVFPPNLLKNLLQDELGSGFFEDDVGSGTRANTDTRVEGMLNNDEDNGIMDDDEDDDDDNFSPAQMRFSIGCEVPQVKKRPPRPREGSVVSITHDWRNKLADAAAPCNMSLYPDTYFLHPVTQYPVRVSSSSYISVKASIPGQDKTLMVDRCWLSTSRIPHDTSATFKDVITNGCGEIWPSLKWLDRTDIPVDVNMPETTFQFRVDDADFQRVQAAIYLHCQFQACPRKDRLTAMMCSVDPVQRCRRPVFSPSPAYCGPLTLGPLQIEKETEEIDDGKSSGSTGHQQKIIIEGLDSATVVGIAFASFFIGIVLVGVLWFIHSRTGMVKNGSSNRRPRSEVNVNGSMTPNSSTPMTA